MIASNLHSLQSKEISTAVEKDFGSTRKLSGYYEHDVRGDVELMNEAATAVRERTTSFLSWL
jgi:hypothetical protein